MIRKKIKSNNRAKQMMLRISKYICRNRKEIFQPLMISYDIAVNYPKITTDTNSNTLWGSTLKYFTDWYREITFLWILCKE